jgi:uncharacterized protein
MTIASETVSTIFAKLSSEEPEAFFQHVADDAQWTVLGTHPLAGLYTSKHEFEEATAIDSEIQAMLDAFDRNEHTVDK